MPNFDLMLINQSHGWAFVDEWQVGIMPVVKVGHTGTEWFIHTSGPAEQMLANAGFPVNVPVQAPLREITQTVASILDCSPQLRRQNCAYAIGDTGYTVRKIKAGTWWLTCDDISEQTLATEQRIIRDTAHLLLINGCKGEHPTRQAAVDDVIRYYGQAYADEQARTWGQKIAHSVTQEQHPDKYTF